MVIGLNQSKPSRLGQKNRTGDRVQSRIKGFYLQFDILFMFQGQSVHRKSQRSSCSKMSSYNLSTFTHEKGPNLNRTSLNLTYKPCDESADDLLPKRVLAKWLNFVRFHEIPAESIWEEAFSMPVLEFVEVFEKKLGYKFSIFQINCLMSLCEKDSLRKQYFAGLNLWTKKPAPKNLLQNLSTPTCHKLLKCRKKAAQKQKMWVNQRNPERMSYQGKFGSISRYSKERIQKLKKMAGSEHMNKTFLKMDFSREPIDGGKLEELRSTLEMNVLENKWQLIVMAGEINKWFEEAGQYNTAKGLALPVYKIINDQDTFTIIKQKDGKEEVIPEVVFLKKYSAIKKKMEKQQLTSDAKQPLFTKVLTSQPTQGKVQESACLQRDRELNESLLQIMRMRSSLEFQYRILAEAAINT